MEILFYAAPHHAGVVDVITGCQREFDIQVTYEQQPDLHNIAGFYRQFWVAIDNNVVVGTIGLIDMGNGRGTLRKMFVRPSHRGKEHGVAQRLLEALEQWGCENGIATLYLGTAPAFKAAHRFYEKNGFALVDEADLPADFQRMRVDNRFYRKLLAI